MCVCVFLPDFLCAGLVVSEQQPADAVLMETLRTLFVHGGLDQTGCQLPHLSSVFVWSPHHLNATQHNTQVTLVTVVAAIMLTLHDQTSCRAERHFLCTYQALRDPRSLHSLQGIIDPAVVAGVVRRGSPQPENHCAVVVGSQPQKLLQAAHTLVGNQVLLVGGQSVGRPEGVVLKHGDRKARGRRSHDTCANRCF